MAVLFFAPLFCDDSSVSDGTICCGDSCVCVYLIIYDHGCLSVLALSNVMMVVLCASVCGDCCVCVGPVCSCDGCVCVGPV